MVWVSVMLSSFYLILKSENKSWIYKKKKKVIKILEESMSKLCYEVGKQIFQTVKS